MTVKEYRENHPHCKFCKHANEGLYTLYCYAKEKGIVFNKAKKCTLYEIKEYKDALNYICRL